MRTQYHHNFLSGSALMLLWCIVSAIAYVTTSVIETTINPVLLCFGVFFMASLTFAAYRIKNFSALKSKIKIHFKHIVLVNITTLGCWFLTIYPLKFIDPSILN